MQHNKVYFYQKYNKINYTSNFTINANIRTKVILCIFYITFLRRKRTKIPFLIFKLIQAF